MDSDRKTAEEIIFESDFNQYANEEDEFDRELRDYEETSKKRSLDDFDDDDEDDKSTRSKFVSEREFEEKILDNGSSNKKRNNGFSSDDKSQPNRQGQVSQGQNRNQNNRNRPPFNQNKNNRPFPTNNRRDQMPPNNWMNQPMPPPHFSNLQTSPMFNQPNSQPRMNFNDNFINQSPRFLPPFNRPPILHPITNQPINGFNQNFNDNNNGLMSHNNFMNNMNLNQNNMNNFRNRPPFGPQLGLAGPFNHHNNHNFPLLNHQNNNNFHHPNNGPNFNQSRPPLIPNFNSNPPHHVPKLEPPFANQLPANHNRSNNNSIRTNHQHNKPLINDQPPFQSQRTQNLRPIMNPPPNSMSHNHQQSQSDSKTNKSNKITSPQSNLRNANASKVIVSNQKIVNSDRSTAQSSNNKTVSQTATISRNLKILDQEAALVGILPIKKMNTTASSEVADASKLVAPKTSETQSKVDTSELEKELNIDENYKKKLEMQKKQREEYLKAKEERRKKLKESSTQSGEKRNGTNDPISIVTNDKQQTKEKVTAVASNQSGSNNVKERTVKIRNLALSCKIEDILSICNSIGQTESLNISITDGDKNAIVIFKNKLDTINFQRRYNLTMLDQSLIKVEFV